MTDASKKVSVIVITHNGKRHLKECFESLARQTYKNFDTYLIDNASTDGSSEYVREYFPWVKIIRFNKNYGFAEGYNKAIKMVKTKYIALLNDDTKTDPRWLEELVKAIESDDSLFAVGSKIMFYDKPEIIQHAGAKLTIIGAGIDLGFGRKDSPEFNVQKYVGAACGAAMLIRRDIFEKLGGFDPDYFAYLEDVDLCWRAWLHGYKVMYIPTSLVYHKFGGSWGGRNSPRRIYLSQRNRIMNLIKNFEASYVIKGIIISIPYEILRIVVLLAKYRNVKGVMAIIKGTIDALINLRKLIAKRKRVQSQRRLSDDDLNKLKLMLSLKESIYEYLRLNKLRV